MKNALLTSAATSADRLALANVGIVEASDNLPAHVSFDILVDGKTVGNSIEWLDEDGNLVSEARNNDVNPNVIEAANDALDEDDLSGTYITVFGLLDTAVAEVNEASGRTFLLSFGAPQRVPLAKAAYVILQELERDGTIDTDELGLDDEFEGIEAFAVPRFIEGTGWTEASVVLFRETARAAVVLNSSCSETWVDADNVTEALLEYFREEREEMETLERNAVNDRASIDALVAARRARTEAGTFRMWWKSADDQREIDGGEGYAIGTEVNEREAFLNELLEQCRNDEDRAGIHSGRIVTEIHVRPS